MSVIRLTKPLKFLVPGLCLGTHCSGGSASLRNASETRILADSAGRACKSVGSKAEPWNQSVAIGEKCRNFIVLVLALFGLVPSVHSFEGAVSEDHAEITFQSAVLPFLAKNCFACHGNGESKADLSLDKYKDDLSLIKDRKVWDNVVNMLEKHEMPPKEEALIRMAQRIRHRRNCQTHIFV